MSVALREVLIAAFLFSTAAHSQTIEYATKQIGGTFWQYDYTISNASQNPFFDEVSIYFDFRSTASVSIAASPTGWSPILIQPDNAIPADGYLDVISPFGLLAPGTSQGGFSVACEYLKTDIPGSQRFEVYRMSDFTLQATGETVQAAPVSSVPEPSTYSLQLVGLALIAARRTQRSR